ncbi:hypothetical protein DL98DRAFT_573475 [Cadophora sp. DSE1049]|nr:hypothetical protein DL98DRAFT_573475 [Cadophora sp. DSE1049]
MPTTVKLFLKHSLTPSTPSLDFQSLSVSKSGPEPSNSLKSLRPLPQSAHTVLVLLSQSTIPEPATPAPKISILRRPSPSSFSANRESRYEAMRYLKVKWNAYVNLDIDMIFFKRLGQSTREEPALPRICLCGLLTGVKHVWKTRDYMPLIRVARVENTSPVYVERRPPRNPALPSIGVRMPTGDSSSEEEESSSGEEDSSDGED